MSGKQQAKKTPPKDVDEYLRGVPSHFLPALKALRAAIKSAAPKAEEVIAYGVPTYKYRGVLVSFAAAQKHCAFYVMSKKPIASRKEQLRAYDLAPTAIRFAADQTLPESLVIAIVKERMLENGES